MRTICENETTEVTGGIIQNQDVIGGAWNDPYNPEGWPRSSFWDQFACSPEGIAVGAIGGGIVGAVAGQLGGAATGALIGMAFGPVGAAIGFFIGRTFGGNVGAAIGSGLGGYLGDRITTPSQGG